MVYQLLQFYFKAAVTIEKQTLSSVAAGLFRISMADRTRKEVFSVCLG